MQLFYLKIRSTIVKKEKNDKRLNERHNKRKVSQVIRPVMHTTTKTLFDCGEVLISKGSHDRLSWALKVSGSIASKQFFSYEVR